MSKITIADAALKLGVSKEAIHNRIRRGSLQSVVEDGIKLVILNQGTQVTKKQTQRRTSTKTATNLDNRYNKLLEEQNTKLQLRVEKLEDETKTLRDQKEQMLIAERVKIEQIYKDKDEQLKNILNTISSKFLLNLPTQEVVAEHEDHLDAEIEIEEDLASRLISLKKYMKKRKFSKKKIQKIEKRLKKVAKKDSRIVIVGKKHYINPNKYDYSDLL